MTRISFAIWKPATFDPAYPGGKTYLPRSLSEIKYVVNHSAEGGIEYLKQGQRPGEEASWMFSNALDGTLYQHYELEMPTWTSGGPTPNQKGVGVEHEGVKPNKFTDQQAETDVRLFLEFQTLCPNLGAPKLGEGLEEHRRVAPGTTTCPNGRTRYDLYDQIGTEDDMAGYTLADDGPGKETIAALVDQALDRANLNDVDARLKAIEDKLNGAAGGPTITHGTGTFDWKAT